ncbi:MAG: hypothetical protein WCJ25_01815 [Candidatus Moraniibacteriota bacterium]
MALQDLNEDIHRRDYEGGKDFRTAYDPGSTPGTGKVSFGDGRWDASQVVIKLSLLDRFRDFSLKHWRWYLVGIAVLAVGAFVANFTILRSSLFANERVTATIAGPTDVASSETVTYSVHWSNNNILGAKDVEVDVTFPGEFRPDVPAGITVSGSTITAKVGDVKGHSSGDLKFSGKFYGSRGSLIYFDTIARFTPDGISGRYETPSRFGVTIVSSPLSFDLIAPQETASGNEAEYVISYKNGGDVAFQNLRLKLTYPDGFQFTWSDPALSDKGSIWTIGTLAPNAGGEIHVKGILTGTNNQSKKMRADIGILQGDGTFLGYDGKEQSTRIVVSPLSITQKVNDKTDLSVSPGEMLSYQIDYVNSGDIGLRDVIITMDVNANLLDMTQLSLDGKGSYDAQKGVITWKAADSPGLARLEPRQGGLIRFNVPVRTDIGTGKGIVIRTTAKIDSPDIPFSSPSSKVIASNALDVRIGAGATLEALMAYNDSVFPGYGPLPPKVGQETGYAIKLRVTNFLNDLSGVKVTATIPTGVRYAGKKSPDSEAVSYNDRTGQLVWDIGTIQGGGKTTRELVIQVALIPGPNLVNRQPALLQDAVLDGTDTFTKNPVNLHSGLVTTNATPESGVPLGADTVVP